MYKKLLSDISIYGFGAIVIKATAFFTLPIYTRIFSPSEFGIIEMFSTIASILSIFMTMGLDSTQSFYFMEAKNKKNRDIREITTSILALRITLGVIIISIVSVLSPFILDFSFDTKLPKIYLIMVASSVLFGNLISQSLEIFRLIYKPWHYIGISFLQTILGIALILYFTYVKKMGVYGYILGSLISSFMVMLIGWVATRDYRDFKRLNVSLWKIFLKFGIPLIPGGIMIWIMQWSDRYFVMKILGSYELGIYSVGAKLAILIALAVETFRKAWWPIAMDMLHKNEKKIFEVVSFWYIALGTIGAVLLTLISPYLVKLFASPSYFEAWKVVGILSWSSIFYGFYLISGLGIFYSRKTYLTSLTHGSGAFLNMVLNYFLTSIYGILGTASATILSLLFSNIIGMIISNRYYKINWRWKWMGLTLFAGMFFIFYFINLR